MSPFSMWQNLDLAGVNAAIALQDAPHLLEGIRACLKGWSAECVPVTSGVPRGAPMLGVIEEQGPEVYRVHSRYLDQPLCDLPLATTVCALLADVSQAWCETQDDVVFGLHCGGVSMNAGAILLAGERRAGKSTLVARLSAEADVVVLCDDVLPIDREGRAVGLGIAPRLRLPLPDAASEPFRAHVARWIGPADTRYGFLPAPSLAPHGTRMPATHFVLLDRRSNAPARLHRLDAGEVLHHLLKRAITGPETTDVSVDAAQALANQLTGLRLVYSDLEDAVTLLMRVFPGDGTPRVWPGLVGPALPPAEDPSPAGHAVPVDPEQAYVRSGAVAARTVGASVFLWRPGEDTLWDLNPVAQAIWTLLELPASATTLAGELAVIFPDVEPSRLLGDTRTLLGALVREGFIVPGQADRIAP